MNEILKNAIHDQRVALAAILSAPLAELARQCADVWGSREQLDIVLNDGFRSVPHCLFLYAVDPDGIQISDNISIGGLLPEHFGRDRSVRPYMREVVPPWGFLLSDAYLSLRVNRPSLTALQVVRRGDDILGFIGADFDLRDLPATTKHYEESVDWRQIKGDPSIRGDICLLYPRCPYPADAAIPQESVAAILNGMRQLRLADETLYLRSASINIFNGLVSLTFSCDGTHYMSWQEFLDKDMSFWVGCAA